MANREIAKLKLNEETSVPILGLGTWTLEGEIAEKAVTDALEIGYRHIDTAEIYDNHKDIGKALRTSGINRSAVFLTSKVFSDKLGKEDTLAACNRALDQLQTDYLDLYLIHRPSRTIPVSETLPLIRLWPKVRT